MSREDKQIWDKYVAKTASRPYDPYRTDTPAAYDLNHATPPLLSDRDG